VPRRRPERRERPAREPEEGGIQHKYRRAYGCVTWVNMAVLVFLLVSFLLSLPFWLLGDVEIFYEMQGRLDFLGIILILPGMALGAVLGARTYRVERSLGMRAGAGVGATAGLASSLLLFVFIESMPLFLVPFAASIGLLLYTLFATNREFGHRRQIVLLAAAISTLSVAVAMFLSFELLGLLGVLFCTVAAAVGGLVGGIGYARAGGGEMLPPDASSKEPRQKPR